MDLRKTAIDLLRGDPTTDMDLGDTAVDAPWFEERVCRNCGAPRAASHCGECGQKAVARLTLRDIGKESWDRVRYFEIKSLRTIARLLLSPGLVAREYVMGRRTAHMHPLTLLIALVAVLVLVLAANRYFQHYGAADGDRQVSEMASRVLAYANWSFSLGIVAIFAGGWLTFGRRLGYNVVEHAVLALYTQIVILALIIVNLAPTLIWRSSDFILAHKAASQHYLYLIKLAVVAAAYAQFFRLKLRTDWWRLLVACLIYVGINWALMRVYAYAILWLVSRST